MNPQNPMDRWIERHLARLEFGRFLRHTAEWLAAFLFVFGAVVLGVKLALPNFWPGVLWLGLLAIPVCVAAWLRSRNARFSRTDSAAMLDQALGAGGLLMTLAECRDARWEERLPQAEAAWREGIPRVRPSRFARFLVLPLMFAVGAGFIPLRKANTEPILRNTVGRKASRDLEEMLDQLEDVAVLDGLGEGPSDAPGDSAKAPPTTDAKDAEAGTEGTAEAATDGAEATEGTEATGEGDAGTGETDATTDAGAAEPVDAAAGSESTETKPADAEPTDTEEPGCSMASAGISGFLALLPPAAITRRRRCCRRSPGKKRRYSRGFRTWRAAPR